MGSNEAFNTSTRPVIPRDITRRLTRVTSKTLPERARGLRISPDLGQFGKAVGRTHQRVDDAGFSDRVAGIGNDVELRLRPGAMQIPGAADWTNNIISSLNNYSGNVPDRINVFNQIVIAVKESAVGEVMTLNACKGKGESGIAVLLNGIW